MVGRKYNNYPTGMDMMEAAQMGVGGIHSLQMELNIIRTSVNQHMILYCPFLPDADDLEYDEKISQITLFHYGTVTMSFRNKKILWKIQKEIAKKPSIISE